MIVQQQDKVTCDNSYVIVSDAFKVFLSLFFT